MDTTTTIIVIAVVVLAIAIFLFMRRDSPTGDGTTTEEDGAFAGTFDRRAVDVPHTDRPGGIGIAGSSPHDDVTGEALDNVRSQNPDRSL